MKNIVFDFDGVIADTNKCKSDAFSYVFRLLNLPNIYDFLTYHKNKGGISAKKKFIYYKKVINPNCIYDVNFLENQFRSVVKKKLEKYGYDFFFDKIDKDKDFIFHIISGGNRHEIFNFLKNKKIDKFFNQGLILGGENSKRKNFEILLNKYQIKPLCYLGDSYNDFLIAQYFKIDFYFISQWTESQNWQYWTTKKKVSTYHDLTKFFNDNFNL